MKQQLSTFSAFRHLSRMSVVLALSLCAAPALAAPDWDILGVKLGMSEAEVREQFAAYESSGQVVAVNGRYSYSDGVDSFRTPDFLDTLELRVTRRSIQIPLKVWFSGPGDEPRVIAVARVESNLPNPVSAAQFLQSLEGKYGQPTGSAGAIQVWEEGDKPSCIQASWGIDLGDFPQVATGQRQMTPAAAKLETKGPTDPLPADLTTCGAFLYYTPPSDPVVSITAGLFDVGAIVATQYGRNAWVEELQAEAVSKREGQAQVPRL